MAAEAVTLVIPGRDCADTLTACLDAVTPLLRGGELHEIVFVDDGSTDETASIAARYPVTLLTGGGNGAGAARNLGWRHAQTPLVWFVDSDCVARPDALRLLRPHLEDPEVAGVSGSYDNMLPGELLACLVHEEIRERHLAMPTDVDFVATFNVLYRRTVLESLGGFDPRYLKGQDAELAFRVVADGHRLHFEDASRVGHFHEHRLLRYLRVQRQQGFWRVFLHLAHRGHAHKNAYSSALDHLQPPLAMATLGALPLAAIPLLRPLPWILAGLLALAQIPLTTRLLKRLGEGRYLAFAALSFLRAFWRGVGLSHGVLVRIFAPPRLERGTEGDRAKGAADG